MDRHWEELRDELPWVTRRPSDYVRDNVRFSSQPIEEPAEKAQLAAALETAQASRLLMYSSDYPHWDFDDPAFVLRQIPRALHDRVLRDNALEFYRLPEIRSGVAA
jgi:predicted TIM-barrel fold metal-dependent hydrolase